MATTRPPVAELATMPALDDLRAFCRVVDLGSMTAAGRALAESKGSVSRRVARLEARVGAALLRRDGRSVVPTEEGRLYRDKAGVALEVLQDAAEALQAGRAAPAGLLRVTAPLGLPGALLRTLLPGFLRAYPAIRVELVLTESVLSFREHRIDVALRFAEGLPDSALVAHRLAELAPLLVASPDYAARRGLPAHPAELADHDLFAVPTALGRVLHFARADGATAEVKVAARVLSHDSRLLYDLALAGAGIAVAPAQAAAADLAAQRLLRVLPDWTLQLPVRLYLIHAGGVLPAKVRAFRDYVQAALRVPCGDHPAAW